MRTMALWLLLALPLLPSPAGGAATDCQDDVSWLHLNAAILDASFCSISGGLRVDVADALKSLDPGDSFTCLKWEVATSATSASYTPSNDLDCPTLGLGQDSGSVRLAKVIIQVLGTTGYFDTSSCVYLVRNDSTTPIVACAGAWAGHYRVPCGGQLEPDCEPATCSSPSDSNCCRPTVGMAPSDCYLTTFGFSGSSELSDGVTYGGPSWVGRGTYQPNAGYSESQDLYGWHALGIQACHGQQGGADSTVPVPGSALTDYMEDCFTP
jgi:hypothetical protein